MIASSASTTSLVYPKTPSSKTTGFVLGSRWEPHARQVSQQEQTDREVSPSGGNRDGEDKLTRENSIQF